MKRLPWRYVGLTAALLAMGCSDDTSGSGGSGGGGGGTPSSTHSSGSPSSTGSSSSGTSMDSEKRPLGSEIAVSFEVLDNLKKPGRFGSQLTLVNNGTVPLGNKGWSLYFNFVRNVLPDTVPPEVKVTHINGDLFKLEPTEKFTPVQPKQSVALSLDGSDWAIKECDAPAGYYFVFTDKNGVASTPEAVGSETVKPFLSEKQTIRGGTYDVTPVPTPKSRYEENLLLSVLAAGDVDKIVPTPVSILAQAGQLKLNSDVGIYYDADGLEQDAKFLADALGTLLGKAPAVAKGAPPAGTLAIALRTGAVIVNGGPQPAGSEAYQLSVGLQGVEIVGSDASGVFHGIQSLRALLPVAAYKSPQTEITVDAAIVADAPRFKYRGMHLDVARNFQGKEAVKKLLELMAFYKLNKFHFHLTDDEGWRLTINGLPELTDVGGRRGHTLDDKENIVPSFGSGPDPKPGISGGSGFYSRADFIEILRFAAARHIEVIPELDMPGHARAAIKAMDSRHAKLVAKGDTAGAEEFLLSDPQDTSAYTSIQGWHDNVVNPCQESTYRFLKKVVDDVASMYTEAGATLTTIHTGGDEVPSGVWTASPACKALIDKAPNDGIESVGDLPAHFLREYSAILQAHTLITGGWEEIGLTKATVGGATVKIANPEFIGKNFQPYAWNNVWGWGDEGNSYNLANAGYPVVLSNATNLYFDLAYDKDPVEPGYYWAGFVDERKPYEFVPLDLYKSAYADRMGNPINQITAYKDAVRLTAMGKANVIGIQGQLWGENDKSPDLMEYLAFPKMISLAERAWAADPAWAAEDNQATRVTLLAAAWSRFANTLGQRDLPRLDHLAGGVKYRIPLPGARIQDGKLLANVAFPGLAIRYTTDGKEPDGTSTVFTGSVAVTGVVKLKSFTTNGRSSRTSVLDPSVPGG